VNWLVKKIKELYYGYKLKKKIKEMRKKDPFLYK